MSSAGYKRPPTEHQFKPGQSGNPKGRPKKPPKVPTVLIPFMEMVREELHEEINITENGIKKKIPVKTAIVRRALFDAITKDDPRYMNMALKLLQSYSIYDESNPAESPEGNITPEFTDPKEAMEWYMREVASRLR